MSDNFVPQGPSPYAKPLHLRMKRRLIPRRMVIRRVPIEVDPDWYTERHSLTWLMDLALHQRTAEARTVANLLVCLSRQIPVPFFRLKGLSPRVLGDVIVVLGAEMEGDTSLLSSDPGAKFLVDLIYDTWEAVRWQTET